MALVVTHRNHATADEITVWRAYRSLLDMSPAVERRKTCERGITVPGSYDLGKDQQKAG